MAGVTNAIVIKVATSLYFILTSPI
jgi:hypothetical protein